MSLVQKLTWSLKQSRPLVRDYLPIIRQQRQGYANQIHPSLQAKYDKLRRNQGRLQVDDGCPVYLKKGMSDKVFYYTTLVLCGIGMACNIKVAYDLIFPSQASSEEEDDD